MSYETMVYPFQYKHLWKLKVDGPLTAGELADGANRRRSAYAEVSNGRDVSNQLRLLVRLGLIEHDGGTPRIWRLTDLGHAYVSGRVACLSAESTPTGGADAS